MNIIWINF